MDQQVQLFNFERADVRVILVDGEPMFVAKDVLIALGYDKKSSGTSGLVRHVPKKWKGLNPIHTLGGVQKLNCLSEQGVYFVIARSDKPKALPMQEWIAGEVLPSIRKTGSYSVRPAKPVMALPDFNDPVAAARAWADAKEREIQAAQQLAIAAPKAAFVDRFIVAEGLYGFRQVAKMLRAKENEFSRWLQDEGIMYRLGGKLTPYDQHLKADRFEMKAGASDSGHAFTQAKFTAKGFEWIAGKWAVRQLEVAA